MQYVSPKLLGVTAWLFLAAGLTAFGPASTPWEGHWQLNDQRSIPPRTKPASLQMDLELSGSVLKVHLDSHRPGKGGDGKLDVTYEMGGRETVYTGTDGDEFHAQARWDGDAIVFTVVEHEDGKLIPYTETWKLIDAGKSLQRIKVSRGRKTISVLERMDSL